MIFQIVGQPSHADMTVTPLRCLAAIRRRR